MQADEFKALREAAGMTQQEFGDAIGMSRKAINEMEKGGAKVERRSELAARWVAGQVAGAIMGQGQTATMNVDQIFEAMRPMLNAEYVRRTD